MRKLLLGICATILLIAAPILLNPPRSPGGIHPVGIWASLLFWPALVLSSLLAITCAIAWLKDWRKAHYFILFCLFCVLPLLGGRKVVLFEREQYALRENERRTRLWYFTYQKQLIPSLRIYISEHPELVSYPFGPDDDRADVTGFLEKFKSEHPEVLLRDGKLWSPWDRQIYLVVDRNQDMRLQANGFRVKAVGATEGELIVGIYDPRWDSTVPYSTSNWTFREQVPADWP